MANRQLSDYFEEAFNNYYIKNGICYTNNGEEVTNENIANMVNFSYAWARQVASTVSTSKIYDSNNLDEKFNETRVREHVLSPESKNAFNLVMNAYFDAFIKANSREEAEDLAKQNIQHFLTEKQNENLGDARLPLVTLAINKGDYVSGVHYTPEEFQNTTFDFVSSVVSNKISKINKSNEAQMDNLPPPQEQEPLDLEEPKNKSAFSKVKQALHSGKQWLTDKAKNVVRYMIDPNYNPRRERLNPKEQANAPEPKPETTNENTGQTR